MNKLRPLLPGEETAEILGKSLRTLSRWRSEGKGPPYAAIGGKVYYPAEPLLSWIERQTTTPPRERV